MKNMDNPIELSAFNKKEKFKKKPYYSNHSHNKHPFNKNIHAINKEDANDWIDDMGTDDEVNSGTEDEKNNNNNLYEESDESEIGKQSTRLSLLSIETGNEIMGGISTPINFSNNLQN